MITKRGMHKPVTSLDTAVISELPGLVKVSIRTMQGTSDYEIFAAQRTTRLLGWT